MLKLRHDTLYHVYRNTGQIMAEWARIVVMGIGATLVMDAWTLAARHLLGLSSLDYRLIGRWIGHFSRGRFIHDTIAQSASVPHEKALGWAAHFGIGIIFASMFASVVDGDWFADPRPEVATLFGVITVAVPFLIMQPALGFGVAASRTSDPLTARVKSVITHAVFGFGLYLSAWVLALLAAL